MVVCSWNNSVYLFDQLMIYTNKSRRNNAIKQLLLSV